MARLAEAAPKLELCIHTQPVRRAHAIADTGASCTVFPSKMAKGIPINTRENVILTTANGQIMACEGIIKVPVSIANHSDKIVTINALVSSELGENILLGWQDCRTFGVIPASFPQPISPPEGTDGSMPVRTEAD